MNPLYMLIYDFIILIFGIMLLRLNSPENSYELLKSTAWLMIIVGGGLMIFHYLDLNSEEPNVVRRRY